MNRQCFAVVFEGDISKLPFNPLKAETVYGKPVAAGHGNPFDLANNIEEFADAMQRLIDALPAGIVITGKS